MLVTHGPPRLPPLRISLRHSARLLRLPLKGGVIPSYAGLKYHSPLEGESARAKPVFEPEGGQRGVQKGCPPGNAGVPPAHLPGTVSADSATWIDRQRGLAFHSDWPMPFTPAGWLPAGNVAPTLHHLQPEIRLRARRPRSRGAGRPRSRVGRSPQSSRWEANAASRWHRPPSIRSGANSALRK